MVYICYKSWFRKFKNNVKLLKYLGKTWQKQNVTKCNKINPKWEIKQTNLTSKRKKILQNI